MSLQKKANVTNKYTKRKVKEVFRPRLTLFSLKNFKLAVDLKAKLEKKTCRNTWSRDIYSTHIRNKRLLDLPFPKPNCCMEVYNVTLDRMKLNKLKKYNLTRPVRFYTVEKKSEETVPEQKSNVPEPPTVIFPECYIVPESSGSDDDSMDEECTGNSENKLCTVCHDPHEQRRMTPRRLTQLAREKRENALCKEMVNHEIAAHKLGTNFKLKLKSFY